MRRGRRVSSQHLVLHFMTRPEPSAPRAGFVVGKVVGNSVVRHRVIRQLRHLVREQLPTLPAGLDVVIRGLAGAQEADLRAELEPLLAKVAARA